MFLYLLWHGNHIFIWALNEIIKTQRGGGVRGRAKRGDNNQNSDQDGYDAKLIHLVHHQHSVIYNPAHQEYKDKFELLKKSQMPWESRLQVNTICIFFGLAWRGSEVTLVSFIIVENQKE